MNRTAFIISVALTTFVLMAVAGVVYALRAPQSASEVDSPTENNLEAQPTLDSSLQQALLERESIYQQRIAEANARLEQAQQQLAAQTSSVSSQPADSQSSVTTITSEQAQQIAANYMGHEDVFWVEVVTVRGEDMYLVTFTTGDLVYVNMSGQVVGSAPAQNFGRSNGGGGKKTVSTKVNNGSHEEHEHEGEGGEHETEDHDD